jgi:hypothetical protein
LLNRAALDGRTVIAKAFDQLVGAIHADLGGRGELSAIECALVEAFAGASVALDHLNMRILAGVAIDNAMVAMHAQACSARWCTSASRLGIRRRAKPIPGLHDSGGLLEQLRHEAEGVDDGVY